MNLIDPVSIYFRIPATDPLGKNEVIGKVRFLESHVELNWRLKGSVFRGGEGEMTAVDLPYSEIESVEVVKGWFSIKQMIVRVGDPQKLKSMPSIEVGKITMQIDKRSKQDAKELENIVELKKSEFILDAHESRMKALREE